MSNHTFVMRGNLREFALTDVLQVVGISRQLTCVELRGPTSELIGAIWMKSGRVINAQFKQGSINLNIRNGVGIMPDGRVVFAISREPVNFFDFGGWFKTQGCTEALYLDGAISRAYIPEAGMDQRDGQLGVLIAVLQ